MKQTLTPIYIIAGFNLLTLAMYVVAPYVYSGSDVVASYFYVALNILILVVGYRQGVAGSDGRIAGTTNQFRRSHRQTFAFLSIFYAATFVFQYAYLMRSPALDVTGMVQQLAIGLADPKIGYLLATDKSRVSTVPWSVFFAISIFDGVYLIIGFLVWHELTRLLKILFLVFVAIDAAYWLGRGTNFGLISLAITVLLSSLIRGRGKLRFGTIVGYSTVFALAVLVFAALMYARLGGDIANPQYFALPWTYVDESSYVLRAVPAALQPTVLTIFSYITQGYYFMSLAFRLDWVPSWFGGWNPSLTSLFSTLGFDVAPLTYMERLESLGIDSRIYWHSAYTWIANDFSFWGVPFVVYVIGFGVGKSWVVALRTDDLLSKVMFTLLSGSAIFFFANNNYISHYFYSFMFLLPIWLVRTFVRSARRAPSGSKDSAPILAHSIQPYR
jgi:hypothetical protein